MPSTWVAHVQNYYATHDVPYSVAMKEAAKTWKRVAQPPYRGRRGSGSVKGAKGEKKKKKKPAHDDSKKVAAEKAAQDERVDQFEKIMSIQKEFKAAIDSYKRVDVDLLQEAIRCTEQHKCAGQNLLALRQTILKGTSLITSVWDPHSEPRAHLAKMMKSIEAVNITEADMVNGSCAYTNCAPALLAIHKHELKHLQKMLEIFEKMLDTIHK